MEFNSSVSFERQAMQKLEIPWVFRARAISAWDSDGASRGWA